MFGALKQVLLWGTEGLSRNGAAPGGGGEAGPVVTYIGTDASASSATVTYENAPIATTAASDLVVVGVRREHSIGSNMTSVTVGATTLTRWTPGNIAIYTGPNTYVDWYFGAPGVLETADIVATATGVILTLGIYVFVVRGCANSQLDAVSTTTFSTDTITHLNVESKVSGAVLGLFACRATARTFNSETWTGGDAVVEAAEESTGNSKVMACYVATTTASTTDDLSAIADAALTTGGGGAISFGPA